MKRILLVAAEASSVLYAERLLQHWKKQRKPIEAFGVGSLTMVQTYDFHAIGASEKMAVFGLFEVIKHYQEIKKIFDLILAEIDRNPPVLAVLFDYPGFNLRLSQELKKRNIPVIYYIAPQVWAWKKNRVKTIRENVTKILAVLPFEKKFFEEHQVPVDFVGHPLLDEIDEQDLDPDFVKIRRVRYGIKPCAHVIGIMPGSRYSEIDRHLSIQMEVARALYLKQPEKIVILVMVAPNFEKEEIASRIPETIKVPYILVKDEPFKMISLADEILVASGTATLMVGLMLKPMIIMYRVHPLSAFVGRRIVKGFFGLVNIIMDREIVPEIFQEKATVKNLTDLMDRYITDTSYRDSVIADLGKLRERLGTRGVTERVAAIIENNMNQERNPK